MDKLWYQDAVFYEVYVRAFADSNDDGQGDLPGLISRLDYLKELGVDCIWLLPIFNSPLVDDGYDVSDYNCILPVYGSAEDFKRLLDEAHARGIRVIADMVMNHTSDQHPWFVNSRSSRNAEKRDYYVWSPTDDKFNQARIIFVDSQKSNWKFDRHTREYYFHRFYEQQPDLNYWNPRVQQEMMDMCKFWLDMGIDGFRCDAVPYLFEREGTNCENLPETHAFYKRLRQFVSDHYEGRVLLAEANQLPQDAAAYFGNADEFQMAFDFPLNPRIFMALRSEERSPIVELLTRMPDTPPTAQWALFLRNHDELSLEMVTPRERMWMWREYAPEPRMRLNLGIRRRLAPLLDNDRSKIELAYSLLFTLPGSPIIYYGDEIGMGDAIWLRDRDGVRTPMQWNSGKNAGFSNASPSFLYAPVIKDPPFGYTQVNVEKEMADPNSLLHSVRRQITVRKQRRVFGRGDTQFILPSNQAILAYARQYEQESVLIVNNLSHERQETDLELGPFQGKKPVDLFANRHLPVITGTQYHLCLEPHEYLWLDLVESDGQPS